MSFPARIGYKFLQRVAKPIRATKKNAVCIKFIASFLFMLYLQVAWMHFEQSAILTVHNHVITRNPRISVTHDKHDKHKTWFLHISNVQEEDKGRYMCQINTVTAKTQFGYLHVVGKSSSKCLLTVTGCREVNTN